jgi:hypothetical protein
VLTANKCRIARFDPQRSVDLAVEGLAGVHSWEAWRLAKGMIGARPEDLIEIEGAGDPLRRTMERCGVPFNILAGF